MAMRWQFLSRDFASSLRRSSRYSGCVTTAGRSWTQSGLYQRGEPVPRHRHGSGHRRTGGRLTPASMIRSGRGYCAVATGRCHQTLVTLGGPALAAGCRDRPGWSRMGSGPGGVLRRRLWSGLPGRFHRCAATHQEIRRPGPRVLQGGSPPRAARPRRRTPGPPGFGARELLHGGGALRSSSMGHRSQHRIQSSHLLQHPMGGAQLPPRVGAAALPAQPFPVQQAGAGQFGADPGPA